MTYEIVVNEVGTAGWGVAANGVRPGAKKVWDAFGIEPGQPGFEPSTAYGNANTAALYGSALSHEALGLTNVVPVDPLVLDLNGDGCELLLVGYSTDKTGGTPCVSFRMHR